MGEYGMKNFNIIMLGIFSIYQADAQEISSIVSSNTTNMQEKIHGFFKVDLGSDLVKISSLNVNKADKVNIKIDNDSYKDEYEELRFQKEIASIPNSSQFIIHLDSNKKVYKISNLGNIFRLTMSHTRPHEDNQIHTHAKSATFKLNKSDLVINTSFVLASKNKKSFTIIESIAFN